MLSTAPSGVAKRSIVLQLQRTYGNSYVQRLLNSMHAQAKLTVNPPNDIYEQEADRVAEAVTRVPLQRQEEEEEPVRMMPVVQLQEEEELQAQLGEGRPADVSTDLESRINNAKVGGQPLSEEAREPMEQALGADFGDVRVHTDSEADEISQQLDARAFTIGRDVFFKSGEYSPVSSDGQQLLAHELTHVVQQDGGTIGQAAVDRIGRYHHSRADEVVQESPDIIQRDDSKLLDYLEELAEANPDGFTVHVDDLESPRDRVEDKVKKFTNYCVGYKETQDCFGRPGLVEALAHTRTKFRFLGGWLDKGKYYFDSVRVYASEYNALEAAIKEGQLAYYSLDGHAVKLRDDEALPLRDDAKKRRAKLRSEVAALGADIPPTGVG
jgi:hypothetical protein